MPYKSIIFEKEGGVVTVTLNRPEKLNAIDPRTFGELSRAINQVSRDDRTKVLIITGAGGAFSSGADLSFPVSSADPNRPGITRRQRLEPQGWFGQIAAELRNLHKPTLAAVSGIAAGAGMAIAAGCDIRIGSDAARFCTVFVRRGFVTDTGLTYLLPRIVGTAKALELMWTGDIIDAREAERIGLLNKVVPAEELMSEVKRLATRLAKGPSVSIEFMKRMVYKGLETGDFASILGYEAWAQNVCTRTQDNKEGIRAFLEKRQPIFKGK